MIDPTATDRPTFQATVAPSPPLVPAPSPDGTTLITEQQVLFSTAAVGMRPAKVSRWATVLKSVSALFTDSRPPAQRHVAKRHDFLEKSRMAREMYRL